MKTFLETILPKMLPDDADKCSEASCRAEKLDATRRMDIENNTSNSFCRLRDGVRF